MPNFVLPYDAERGMIPLINHHLSVEAPLSFYTFASAGRYDFQDNNLANIVNVYLLRGLVLEFSKVQIVKSQEVLCNPQISIQF